VSVGVIVPVYAAAGQPRYLEQSLDAVLSQAPPPGDVIVVDDGSPEPVRLSAAHGAACRLVRREQRGGPGPARDTALTVLGTDLVACADADDVWLPGKLAAQLEALEAAPDAALCFGVATTVGPDGRPTGETWKTLDPGLLPSPALAASLYEHNPIPTSTVVARRQAVLDAGGFTGPPLCEDWDLWLRMLGRGDRFILATGGRILYRRHAGGATADISALAESALEVHARHAALVDGASCRRVRARDLVALARGRVRERRYADARRALDEAAGLAPLNSRDRALRAVLGVPVIRAGLGRRGPY
jgi:glycosyltransferase involved in cell wall biosynthesis